MDKSTTSDKDQLLLSLLRENARTSVALLARRLGLSRTTVQSKMERLERDGVVVGYTVRISDSAEQATIKAHVLITVMPKASQRMIVELHRIQEVRTLHSVSGEVDLIAIVAARSVAELDMLIDRIGELDGVERTQSAVILSTKIDR